MTFVTTRATQSVPTFSNDLSIKEVKCGAEGMQLLWQCSLRYSVSSFPSFRNRVAMRSLLLLTLWILFDHQVMIIIMLAVPLRGFGPENNGGQLLPVDANGGHILSDLPLVMANIFIFHPAARFTFPAIFFTKFLDFGGTFALITRGDS